MQRNNMKPNRLKEIITEEVDRVLEQEAARITLAEGGFDPYVIMNKSGIITNRATKLQAIGFARKKAGVYAIPDKPKVLKTAQKLIKKMSGAKLKDAMFDLRFEGKLTEAKIKKGDIIKMDDGEYGVVNKVSGRVAYIKLPSMPKSFHPIEAARITYKGKHKGRDLYSESLNEAAMEFGVEYRDAKGKPKKKNEPVVMRFKTKPSADKFAKKGNQMDKVGGKYTVVRVQVEENVAPDHDGKSAPYGSGYKKEKDLTEAKDRKLNKLFQQSLKASVKDGEDKLYKLSQDWEDWNVDNDDKYDDLVDTLFAALELLQDAGEPGKNNVVKDKEYYSYMKSAAKLLKQFNKDVAKAAKLHTEGTLIEAKKYKAGDTIKLRTGETVKINQVVKGTRPELNTYRAKVKGKQVDFSLTDIKEGRLNEAEEYKYKKQVGKAFEKINDAMFNFRHSMGLKQLTNKDMKLKKKVESLHSAIFDLQKEMRKDGLSEGKLNEMDINDPILVAIRARKTDLKKKAALPKVKKISTKQYYKLMDKEIDLIDQMKDAAKEYERLDSEMNQDAGQKGSNWTDADANRYGGDLNKLQTKVEKLAKLKLAVKKQIMDYRVN